MQQPSVHIVHEPLWIEDTEELLHVVDLGAMALRDGGQANIFDAQSPRESTNTEGRRTQQEVFDEAFANSLDGDGRDDSLGGLVRDEDEMEGSPCGLG